MKQVIVLDGQTYLDIAIQELGDVERAFELALLNDATITDLLIAGQIIQVPSPAIDKTQIVKVLSAPANKPSSGVSDIESESLVGQGIGYWAIGVDFIVN
jgi:LysM repeat protein